MGFQVDTMVFDSSGSSDGGRALWMENIMPTGGVGYPGHLPHGPPAVGMRSLPPYQPPSPPSRYHYPTYTSPWLVRVSHTNQTLSTDFVKFFGLWKDQLRLVINLLNIMMGGHMGGVKDTSTPILRLHN